MAIDPFTNLDPRFIGRRLQYLVVASNVVDDVFTK